MAKDPEKIIRYAVLIMTVALLTVFSWHIITSINTDIGRHIKSGEIIWQTKNVPKTNLFSFTEPDHAFIDHHWLSQIIFYIVDRASGLDGLNILKSLLITAAFVFSVLAVYKKELFWQIIFAAIFATFIIST